MAIRRHQQTFTTTGANGSAGITDYTPPIIGKIQSLYVDYTGQPATTDVTITTTATPAQTIYTKTDSNTDAWVHPRVALTDTGGMAITYDGTRPIYGPIVVADQLKVVVAQGDGGASVTVTIIYEE